MNARAIWLLGRTITYLVVYSTAGKEVFSSDAYSVEQLLAAIQEAQKSP